MTNSKRMPALFIGHGSPMNAIEDNDYTRNWVRIAQRIPKPEAILVISAHWFTDGSRITDDAHPKMVYDMYGFPDALYEVKYMAKNSPELAYETKSLIKRDVMIDNSWGYDHGTWSVLCRMYPKADIPVIQLSVDGSADAEIQFEIGRQIGALRDKGILILGSGNVVHNLSKLDWEMAQGGFPWAVEFDETIKDKIIQRHYREVVNYRTAGQSAFLAVPTPDHFFPLLTVLGASREDDRLSVFNDSCTMGSLSMTCYLFGQ